VPASPALVDASAAAASLLSSWRDADADDLLADNVGPDEPYERRTAEAASLVDRHGTLRVESLEAETPMRGSFSTAGGEVKVEIGLNHVQRVQWLDVEDRQRPSDAPIVVDERWFHRVAGAAFVVVRPVGELAERFTMWQGEVLDRLGAACVAPGAHATVKSFGSTQEPLTDDEERRIVEVVRTWAASCSPVALHAAGLEVFSDASIPVVRLHATTSLADALTSLRVSASEAGLPAGSGDEITAVDWVPHLSLAYPVDAPAVVAEVEAWMRGVPVEVAPSTALQAEVVAYDDGSERRLATFPFAGA
jgi:hypothetical protein